MRIGQLLIAAVERDAKYRQAIESQQSNLPLNSFRGKSLESCVPGVRSPPARQVQSPEQTACLVKLINYE